MSKRSKKQNLSEGQERLLDLFAGINRWTTRGENKAFVFLNDGKECLLFANRLEDLSRDMAMTINHDPKMAAVFSMMAEDASILADSMREDISEWKEAVRFGTKLSTRRPAELLLLWFLHAGLKSMVKENAESSVTIQ